MDPITLAMMAASASGGGGGGGGSGGFIGAALGGFGGLFGKKRPKVPPELAEISAKVLALAKNLPQSPEALDALAQQIQSGANLWEMPPEQLKSIANKFTGERIDATNEAAALAGEDAHRARGLYEDSYLPVEQQAAKDAMEAGTPWEREKRAGIAAGRSRTALASAHQSALDAAMRRGVAPSAAAITDPTMTAAGADAIARSAYDADENERRLGFSMRAGLLPQASDISRRGVGFDDAAAGLSRSAQQLGAGIQDLHLTALEADNRQKLLKEQSLLKAFDAHSGSHRSKLDTSRNRGALYDQAFRHYRGTHADKTDYWRGRRDDIREGIGAVGAAASRFGGALGGGNGGGSFGAHGYGGGGGWRTLNSFGIRGNRLDGFFPSNHRTPNPHTA